VSEWISVKKQLPREGECVLTWEKDGYSGCAYINFIPFRGAVGVAGTNKIGRFNSGHDYITHWMPLPDPPEAQP